MFEGNDLFEDPGFSVDPITGDVNGGGYSAGGGFSVDPNTGDVVGVGAGVPRSDSMNGWLDGLKSLGGKAVDAYRSYAGLETQRAQIDATRAAADSAAQRTRDQAQLQRDLLGFQGQAERARAQQAASLAQRGYSSGALVAGIPLELIAVAIGAFLLLRRA